MLVMQGLSDVKRLVVADKNYHERCLRCQVITVMSYQLSDSMTVLLIA